VCVRVCVRAGVCASVEGIIIKALVVITRAVLSEFLNYCLFCDTLLRSYFNRNWWETNLFIR